MLWNAVDKNSYLFTAICNVKKTYRYTAASCVGISYNGTFFHNACHKFDEICADGIRVVVECWSSYNMVGSAFSRCKQDQWFPPPGECVFNGEQNTSTGFPLDLENLENLEKWEYTWKTWKYHGILKNLINIMEKWHETWKNLVATKNSPLTPLKQYKIH